MNKLDFPTIKNGIVYLDSGASSLKPVQVLDAMDTYYRDYGVNIHRGVYSLSYQATQKYEEARQNVADFINAKYEEVIFTRGASSALNLVASSYGMEHVNEGDEIIVTELEHHSSLLPWQNVAKVKKAKLVYIPLDIEGRITIENFKSVVTKKTKVLAITYVSNVLGYITPLKAITKYAHEKNIIVTVDAAQAIPHHRIDVVDLDCDFLSFSGHKMCGPSGIGVLFGKKELLNKMTPVEFGGDMNDNVDLFDASFKDTPFRFETGTMPIAEAIGLSAAVDYLKSVEFNILEHELKLKKYAVEKLSKITGVTVYNPNSDTGIIAFNIDGVHPHDAASVFDQNNICLRAGHHCAQLVIKWLGVLATLRVTFYIYNTIEDVDKFIESVIESRDFFMQF